MLAQHSAIKDLPQRMGCDGTSGHVACSPGQKDVPNPARRVPQPEAQAELFSSESGDPGPGTTSQPEIGLSKALSSESFLNNSRETLSSAAPSAQFRLGVPGPARAAPSLAGSRPAAGSSSTASAHQPEHFKFQVRARPAQARPGA
jgi:hypothetical protein